MKRGIMLLALLALLGAGTYFVLWHTPGGRGVSLGGVEIGGAERSWLADRTIDFFEDLQFKDFETASTYHLPETQKKRDIPALIRRAFGIKHEVLDIVSYRVLEVDLDRSKTRARVRGEVNFHVLGPTGVRDHKESTKGIEMLLYWFRGADGKWSMDLESSL